MSIILLKDQPLNGGLGRAPRFSTGNRCGHDNQHPPILAADPIFRRGDRFGTLATQSSPDRPYAVLKMVRRLKEAYYSPEIIPTSFHDHTNLDGTPQKKRAEARSMAIKLLITILVHTDWKTMQVGYHAADGEFKHRSLAFLGYCAGYPHRDMQISGDPLKDLDMAGRFTWAAKRVVSASRYLQKMGAVTIHERYETLCDEQGNPVLKSDGNPERRALVAIKTVNPDFLRMIGVRESELKNLRNFSSQKQTKQNKARNEQIDAANRLLAKQLSSTPTRLEQESTKAKIVNKGGYARVRNLVAFEMSRKGEKPDAKTVHRHARSIIDARDGPKEPDPTKNKLH